MLSLLTRKPLKRSTRIHRITTHSLGRRSSLNTSIPLYEKCEHFRNIPRISHQYTQIRGYVSSKKGAGNPYSYADYMGKPELLPEHFSWETDLNRPVEVVYKHQHFLGLLQRPDGRRMWWVLFPDGTEEKINRYNINFMWPVDGVDRETDAEVIKELDQQYMDYTMTITVKTSPQKIWDHFRIYNYLTGEEAYKFVTNMEELDPIKVYAFHRLLMDNQEYFQPLGNGVFHCRTRKEIYAEMAHEKEDPELSSKSFIEKIKNKLENKYDEDSETWNEQDITYLQEIRDYSLSDKNQGEVNTMISDILVEVGYDKEPIGALKLQHDLGIIDLMIYNPHIQRYRLLNPMEDGGIPKEDIKRWVDKLLEKPIPDSVGDIRVDLDDLPVFAIDESYANERDDAISYVQDIHGHDWVYVHISDPTRFIDMKSPLINVFIERYSSVYLPEETWNMIPEPLSNILFSLNDDKASFTLTFKIKLKNDGGIDKYEIVPSIVRNVYNLNFDEVDSMMTGEPTSDKLKDLKDKYFDDFIKLERLAQKRRNFRKSHRAIISYISEPIAHIKTQESDEISVDISVKKDFYSNSRGIITEFMYLVNELAGEELSKYHLLAAFRGSDEVPDKKFESSRDPLEDRIRQEALLRSKNKTKQKPNSIMRAIEKLRRMPQSYSSLTAVNHSALGLAQYVQVTSPVRRVTDLLAHYQLKNAMLTKANVDPVRIRELPHAIFHNLLGMVKAKEREIKNLQNQSTRYWVLRCMENEFNETPYGVYESLVVQVEDEMKDSTCILLRHMIRVKVGRSGRRKFTKGEIVYLKIDYVQPYYDELVMTYVPEKDLPADIIIQKTKASDL
eukprot:TRINITY_DN11565_c0_g1_i1.p1 TRINITY_DN11565_c0_g1~~TRINITY_DN11565_c0_g1_i1.p1  ORF type:complete len:841 (-),score=184.62 TRINITY_DN11565_c0_g1_i1:39-2561(-)